MDHNKETQSVQESLKTSNSRRTILKRASAGVVLTSLPAQSVWGAVCTLSGAQSGNMSGIERHKDCEKPVLFGGRSPGTWTKLAGDDPSKLHAVFTSSPEKNGQFSAHDIDIRQCYMDKIKVIAMSNNMVRPENVNELINGDFENNVYSALGLDDGSKPGGLDYNMAAVWLNVYFGLYNNVAYQTEDANYASAVVEQFLAYLVIQHNSGSGGTISDGDYGFTDGNTNFSINECDSMPAPEPKPEPPCIPNGKSGKCK
jgi:hypothetical protein